MNISPINLSELHSCLAGLPPVELKGMALLRERRATRQFFPQLEGGQQGIPRETIAEAVTEIIDYTERCRRAAQQLAKLTPIPLTTIDILEFGL